MPDTHIPGGTHAFIASLWEARLPAAIRTTTDRAPYFAAADIAAAERGSPTLATLGNAIALARRVEYRAAKPDHNPRGPYASRAGFVAGRRPEELMATSAGWHRPETGARLTDLSFGAGWPGRGYFPAVGPDGINRETGWGWLSSPWADAFDRRNRNIARTARRAANFGIADGPLLAGFVAGAVMRAIPPMAGGAPTPGESAMRELRVSPWRIQPGDEIDYRWTDGTIIRFRVTTKPYRVQTRSPFTRERRYRVPAAVVDGSAWRGESFLYGGALEAFSGDKLTIRRPAPARSRA